jgi:prepilin-type N-terminal cleavage/methylation domain-containing protein
VIEAKRRKRRHASGLTLIEVMLAVTILSVGLTVLLTGASRGLAVMKTARNYQTALWTLGLGEVDPPPTVNKDVEELEVEPESYPNGFTFSRTVEKDEETKKDEETGLYIVRTRVAWPGHGGESYEEVVRYVFHVNTEGGTEVSKPGEEKPQTEGGGTSSPAASARPRTITPGMPGTMPPGMTPPGVRMPPGQPPFGAKGAQP